MLTEGRPSGGTFIDDFLRQGFCVVSLEESEALARIRSRVVETLKSAIDDGGQGLDDVSYLNRFHEFAEPSAVNAARLKVLAEVGGAEDFKQLLFQCAKRFLFGLIGTEIAMQRQVNLVIQLPGDSTSLHYLHTDVWSGCSPYEIILWLPLVNVFGTKSMSICAKDATTRQLRSIERDSSLVSAAAVLEKVKPDLLPLTMNFGDALLFSSTLLHGAEENKTDETRFILNVRFKSLFSPYGTKSLGETFLPLNYLPATQIGLSYESEFGIVRG